MKADLAPDTPGFRVLCPTRWTVRGLSLQSVLDNYEVLLSVWEEALDGSLESEMRARIIGVEAQMLKFEFLFGVRLGALILHHSDNLSSTLQHKNMSAAEGQRLAQLPLSVLKKMRCDGDFSAFYQLVLRDQSCVGISAPCLPRKCRAPQCYEVGSSAGSFHESPEVHYQQIYFGALDHAIEAIHDRFDQPGYRIYQNLEQLIVKASKGNHTMMSWMKSADSMVVICPEISWKFSCLFYSPCVRKTDEEVESIHDIIKILRELSSSEKIAFSSVWTAMKLLLVMPATNATSECSFSALRRIKSYLRSTMSQQRLNNLMLLYVNKDKTDVLDLRKTGQEFVSGREGRIRTFGDFGVL